MDRNLRIRMLLEAADRVTRPLRDIAGGSAKAARALKQTRDELKSIKQAQADIDGFKALKLGLTETGTRLDAARAKVAELTREVDGSDKPTAKLARSLDKAQRELTSLETAERKQSQTLTEMQLKLHLAGAEADDLTRHERRLRMEAMQTNRVLGQQAEELRKSADRARRFAAGRDRFQKMQGTAVGMAASGAAGIGTGIAIAAPIDDAARDAMGFEDSMAEVRKVVDGLDTPETFGRMSKDILDLSKRLPMAAEGIAAIVASGGQSGIKGRSALLVFAEDATKMGIAFDITADAAGDMMAKWRTAFAMDRNQVVRLADQVNYLGNTTAAKAPLISDIVTRIGPLGSVGGLASGSIAALGATLGGMGIESEIAATGIKNMMLAMTKGDAATKSQHAVWKAIGLDAKAVALGMQRDANATVLDVMARLNRLPKEAQAGMMSQLFGSESIAAIAPMLTQLDVLRDNFAKVGDASRYAGSMEAEYASRAKTTSNAVMLANNQIQAAKIAIGNQLLPVIARGAEWFGRMAASVSDFTRRHPGLVKALAVGLGLFAALFMVLGGGAMVLAALVAPFAALSFAAGALGVGLLPLIGIAAGVVLGIVALGAAAYLIYSKWDAIWGAISGVFTRNWTTIRNLLLGAFVIFFPFVAALMLVARRIYENWDVIKGAFNAGVAWLWGMVGPFVQPMLNILARIEGLKARFWQFGIDLIKGLGNGLLSASGWLISKVLGLASRIGETFAKAMGIHSPSRVFMGFGGNIVQGLSNGIAAREAEPVKRIDSLSARLATAVTAGAVMPAAALASAGPVGGTPASAQAAGARVYNITINAQPGQSAEDLARMVADEIDRRELDRAAAARSTLADTDEWGS